jgi:uncharacterized protein YbcI
VNSALTIGQLERQLSQQLQALYRDRLGHQPGKVTCQLFQQKLAVIIENSITFPERLLATSGQAELALQVRATLAQSIEPYIRAEIERVLAVPVEDFLSDATLDTGRTAIVAILVDNPVARTNQKRNSAKKNRFPNQDKD